jgi:hypothetical protein
MVVITQLLPVRPATAAYRLHTEITAGEEYNDNIYLTRRDREFDYITRVVPSLGVTYKAPLWDWDASFAYDYSYYALAAFQKDKTYAARLNNNTRLVRDVLFLAVNDTYNRVSLDLARDFTQQSSFVNQTDQNILSANPYITLHPDTRTNVSVGYIYQNIWYKDPNAIDTVDHITYAEMGHELSSQMTMTVAARYIQDTNRLQDYNESHLSGGVGYEYLDGSILFGAIGNIWLRGESGPTSTQPYWNAGFTHKFPKFLFNFVTALSYLQDPLKVLKREDRYTATITREVERTKLGITGSIVEYRNARSKHLETTTYSVTGSVSHAITTKSTIKAELTIERLEDNVYDTFSDLYLSGVRYEYKGWENGILTLAYRYTNSYSPDVYDPALYNTANYQNNRLMIEFKREF